MFMLIVREMVMVIILMIMFLVQIDVVAVVVVIVVRSHFGSRPTSLGPVAKSPAAV